MKFSIVEYKNESINSCDLSKMYVEYFKEMHEDIFIGTEDNANLLVDNLIKDSKLVYMLYDGNKSVGFITLFSNNQYGMTKPVLCLEYMYIRKEYRSTNAVLILFALVGDVAIKNDMDCIGTTFNTSANVGNNEILKGQIIAGVTHFKLEDVKTVTNRLIKFIDKKGLIV